MVDRTHRAIKSNKISSSIQMTVETVTTKTITLSSPETGIFKWPASHLANTPKKGDTISLTLGNIPKPTTEKPDLSDLRSLLQDLVG